MKYGKVEILYIQRFRSGVNVYKVMGRYLFEDAKPSFFVARVGTRDRSCVFQYVESTKMDTGTNGQSHIAVAVVNAVDKVGANRITTDGHMFVPSDDVSILNLPTPAPTVGSGGPCGEISLGIPQECALPGPPRTVYSGDLAEAKKLENGVWRIGDRKYVLHKNMGRWSGAREVDITEHIGDGDAATFEVAMYEGKSHAGLFVETEHQDTEESGELSPIEAASVYAPTAARNPDAWVSKNKSRSVRVRRIRRRIRHIHNPLSPADQKELLATDLGPESDSPEVAKVLGDPNSGLAKAWRSVSMK